MEMNIEAMQRFFAASKKRFMQIVYKTAGELELGDVQNTAYELAMEIRDKRGAFDFDADDDRDYLMARLWNQLVTYADTKLRYAASLDEEPDEDRPTQATVIARSLSAPETADPAVLLERAEEEEESEERLLAHYSELVAYLMLFRRFDTRKGLAAFLRIATCTLRYRVHRAVRRAEHAALFDGVESIDPDFHPMLARGYGRPAAQRLTGEQWEWSF